MRFILGVIVGAALVIGGAYYHDTQMVRAGAAGKAQQFVNWDTFFGALGR